MCQKLNRATLKARGGGETGAVNPQEGANPPRAGGDARIGPVTVFGWHQTRLRLTKSITNYILSLWPTTEHCK